MDYLRIPSLPKIKDGKRTFYNPNDESKEKYNEIKQEIVNKYNSTTASRDFIIKQLIATITHNDVSLYADSNGYNVPKLDIFIIRTDIKNFFPSINKHQLYRKLQKGSLLNLESIEVLKPMLFSNRVSGIPLGLPFSSALAEIYLENFDEDIEKIFNPTFYFRYVDDIIIMRYNTIEGLNESEERKKLYNIFSEHLLEVNVQKTEINQYIPKSQKYREVEFNYLGYAFKIHQGTLKISIEEEKLKKVKSKIKKYFYHYKSTNNDENVEFWKLYYRIKNVLYGITSRGKNNKEMKFGFGFSYRFMTESEPIEELLNLVRSLIFSCELSSRKKHILLSLIKKYETDPMDLLKERYDYTKLSINQRKTMRDRLKLNKSIPDIHDIFREVYYKK